jgi:hypothetical protein
MLRVQRVQCYAFKEFNAARFEEFNASRSKGLMLRVQEFNIFENMKG